MRWLIGLLALGLLVPAALADDPKPLADRDTFWRSFFARPSDSPSPAGNVPNAAKLSLGYDLFRDPRLSGREERTCASCHDPSRAFSNGEARGIALDGSPLKRNVPALYGLAWGQAFYWDGRAPSLEAQAHFPITAANEMGGDFSVIVKRLAADEAMRTRFAAAFPDEPQVSETTILKAIAAYERSLLPPKTRFDLWVEGNDGAIGDLEKQGFSIFVGKGGCVACHGGWRLTDDAFHDIGLPGDDPGRGAIDGGVPGLAQFKTPSLRESLHTAPYMHDGSLATLDAVVDHYSGGLIKRPSLAVNVQRDLRLSEPEKRALVAFLKTLASTSH